MIESVHFTTFKALRDVKLDGLQPLTVLVGPNGVGKSSALQGIERLCQLGTPQMGESSTDFHRAGRIFIGRWAPGRLVTGGGAQGFEIAASVGGESIAVAAARDAKVHDGYRFHIAVGGSMLVLPSTDRGAAQAFVDQEPMTRLPDAAILKLDAIALSESSITDLTPALAANGAGLPSLLAYLAGAYRDRLDAIEKHLRHIVGITGRIRTLPTKISVDEEEMLRVGNDYLPRTTRREVPGHRLEIEVDEHGFIPADHLSEGTLITLALLTVLSQPDGPRLLLLDDIDQGLHPSAQARLIEALRALLAERPDVQIICTSHSPYLLDHFRPEEVQVMSLGPGSHVAAARLDLHPEWPKWRGMMQTGEFWQSVGEAWVVERAASHGA